MHLGAAAGGEDMLSTVPQDVGALRVHRELERDCRAEPCAASGDGRMFCSLAPVAPRRATGIARGDSEST